MPYLKNPFGLRNGEIVMIEDILPEERGQKCNCVCPACGVAFEARLGNIRIHHFAHSGEGCSETIAFLSGMYALISEYIKSHAVTLSKKAHGDLYKDFTKQIASRRFTISA